MTGSLRKVGLFVKGGLCEREQSFQSPHRATEAGCTHPTGMHSCLILKLQTVVIYCSIRSIRGESRIRRVGANSLGADQDTS